MCVLVLVAITGPNQPSAAATQASAAKSSKDSTQPRNPADAQIERTIKNKLLKSKMNSDHFTVSVVKGVATLEGTTNVMQHKGAMTRMAKSSGATSVQNNIRISDAAKSKALAALAKGRSAPSPASRLSTAPGRFPAELRQGRAATSPPTPPIPRATVLPASHLKLFTWLWLAVCLSPAARRYQSLSRRLSQRTGAHLASPCKRIPNNTFRRGHPVTSTLSRPLKPASAGLPKSLESTLLTCYNSGILL